METNIKNTIFWYAIFCNSEQGQKKDAMKEIEGKVWPVCE
jgi:hypothetical protein